ncbi:hypothetical protein MUK42_08200 [Musa troglodytarum]|uniref:Uncharacterized protein n=1 Tax=Musa troglodytarum TaxID=320322 RepID=A0A9E7JCS9_9LILI|nr:hypothetical protein MUK42_08200 [Musa troglodytarum]
MKATVKGRYEVDKSVATATLAVHAGDARLKTSFTDATLVLSVEKPGAFILDYNVPNKFMNSFKAVDKTVNLTYTHARAANRTTLDGSLVFDPANKVSVNHAFGSGNCKDVSKNAWDFALTRKFEGGDSLKATYQTTTKNLGLEWNRDSKDSSFKVIYDQLTKFLCWFSCC